MEFKHYLKFFVPSENFQNIKRTMAVFIFEGGFQTEQISL